ncbi:hypothetical protein DFH09DRAFT_1396407 [Mycena vulgaris]|nr:hypothetical protein DFH09DRAFT_1396407 [Mycena vulgaris]
MGAAVQIKGKLDECIDARKQLYYVTNLYGKTLTSTAYPRAARHARIHPISHADKEYRAAGASRRDFLAPGSRLPPTIPTSSSPLIPASPSPRHATACEHQEARGRNKGESAAGREREDERKSTTNPAVRRKPPSAHAEKTSRSTRAHPHPSHDTAPDPQNAAHPLRACTFGIITIPPPSPRARRPHSPTACACTHARAVPTHQKRNDAKRTDGVGGKEGKEKETAERRRWGRRGMTTNRRKVEEKPKHSASPRGCLCASTADARRRLSIKRPADETRRRIGGHAVRHKRTDAAGTRTRTRPQGRHPRSASTPRTLVPRRRSARQRMSPVTRGHDHLRHGTLRYPGKPRRGAAHEQPHSVHSVRRVHSAHEHEHEHGLTAAASSAYRWRVSARIDAQLGCVICVIADGEDGKTGEENAGMREVKPGCEEKRAGQRRWVDAVRERRKAQGCQGRADDIEAWCAWRSGQNAARVRSRSRWKGSGQILAEISVLPWMLVFRGSSTSYSSRHASTFEAPQFVGVYFHYSSTTPRSLAKAWLVLAPAPPTPSRDPQLILVNLSWKRPRPAHARLGPETARTESRLPDSRPSNSTFDSRSALSGRGFI